MKLRFFKLSYRDTPMANVILQCEKIVKRKIHPRDKRPSVMKCGTFAECYKVSGKSAECTATLCFVHAEQARAAGFSLTKVQQ